MNLGQALHALDPESEVPLPVGGIASWATRPLDPYARITDKVRDALIGATKPLSLFDLLKATDTQSRSDILAALERLPVAASGAAGTKRYAYVGAAEQMPCEELS